MGMDPLYLIFSLPALLLSMIFSARVKSTFAKWQGVRAACGMTGAEAAATMLAGAGVNDVAIKRASGFLTDHYNPLDNTLNLSDAVYRGRDLSALGVACHEAGHALQKAQGYKWMGVRTALVPAANLGSSLSYIVFFAGLALSAGGTRTDPYTGQVVATAGAAFGMTLVKLGLALFSAAVAFSVVTLPVEWDASARAKKALVANGILSESERRGASEVLNAAFMTYIAAAVSSISTLLYFLVRSGLLGGGRRR